MAIAPLQFVRPEEYASGKVDFTPLSEIGNAIAGARQQRQLADAVTAATGPDGKIDANQIGVSLAKLGLPKEAMPFILAGQTAQFHRDTVAHQDAQLAELARHNKIGEGQSAATLAELRDYHNKPQLVVETDPFTGEKTHTIFDPRTRTSTPLVPPQQPTQAAPQPTQQPQQSPFPPAPVPQAGGPGPQTVPQATPDNFAPQFTPAPVSAQPASSTPQLVNGRNEQFFQSLRPDMQGPVKDLADGKTTLEDYLPRQRPILERSARMYAPSWSPADNTHGLSNDAIDMGGRQLADGNLAALTNVGRGAQSGKDLAKLRNKAADVLINERGLTPSEAAEYLNKQEQRYKAQSSGMMAQERSLGTMEARMGTAAFEAEGAIKLARGAIEKVGRVGFLPFNKLIEMKDRGLLNPDQTELAVRAQGVVNAYSAVMSRGANITTDSSRSRADSLLNTAGDAATFNRALDVMTQEINMAKNAPEAMRDFYSVKYGNRSLTSGGGQTTNSATPPATTAPTQRVGSHSDVSESLSNARAAISKGMPRDQVIKKLIDGGVPPEMANKI